VKPLGWIGLTALLPRVGEFAGRLWPGHDL